MFGYVTAAPNLLNDTDKIRYRGWYCGLCKALGKCIGQKCRFLLTYDMAFLAMLLSSVYQMKESSADNSCIIHPFKKHTELRTQASDYAACMNVVLAYYKFKDDWQDDKDIVALTTTQVFRNNCKKINRNYPRQCNAIVKCLSELSELERNGEFNPDLPANCFGELMGELFVIDDSDELCDKLRLFGRTLGRFIYIMDAAVDLKNDLKRQRYNPLMTVASDEIHEMLTVMGGDFMRAFQNLPLSTDRELMENILCAGIWTKYNMHFQKSDNNKENINGKKSL